jgi:hypothetical protein
VIAALTVLKVRKGDEKAEDGRGGREEFSLKTLRLLEIPAIYYQKYEE